MGDVARVERPPAGSKLEMNPESSYDPTPNTALSALPTISLEQLALTARTLGPKDQFGKLSRPTFSLDSYKHHANFPLDSYEHRASSIFKPFSDLFLTGDLLTNLEKYGSFPKPRFQQPMARMAIADDTTLGLQFFFLGIDPLHVNQVLWGSGVPYGPVSPGNEATIKALAKGEPIPPINPQVEQMYADSEAAGGISPNVVAGSKSGSVTRCGCGLRVACWRRASTLGSGAGVLAMGLPAWLVSVCKHYYALSCEQCKVFFQISVSVSIQP